MPPRATTRRQPLAAPPRIVLAVLSALLVGLVGGLGGGPRAALGADPTPPATATPSPADTASPTPAPTPTPTPTATPTPTPTPSPTPTPAPTPTPTPTPGVTVLGATTTFFGHGYGHGVGMSQYGARGRALAVQDSTAILAHYYRGATLGTISTSTRIRVRILDSWKASASVPFTIYGRNGAWTVDGVATAFPADAVLRLIPTTTTTSTGPHTTWRLRITAANGAVLYAAPKPASLVVRCASTASQLQLWSKPSVYDQYRGILGIRASTTIPTVTVVDVLPMETYLAGVVPVEMPSSWPTAALRAQAIASRSYAARRLHPAVSYYDVVDTSASQVYRGTLGERATTNAIIKATTGVVLRSGSSIADTLFHSTGGGGTENNENVYTSSTGAKVAGPVSYLRGSLDRDGLGRSYDAGAPYATWSTRAYTRAQLSAWFAADARTNVGNLTAIDLRDRGVSGRLISVTLIGSSGTKRVSGEVFRSVFDAHRPAADPMLYSTLFSTVPIP